MRARRIGTASVESLHCAKWGGIGGFMPTFGMSQPDFTICKQSHVKSFASFVN